jgi:hypothetical protein
LSVPRSKEQQRTKVEERLKREIERLRQELAERERQITEQAKRIADLERQLALRLQNSMTTLSGDTKQLRGTEVRLTQHGEAILAGKGNAVEWNGIDDWVGGVHELGYLGMDAYLRVYLNWHKRDDDGRSPDRVRVKPRGPDSRGSNGDSS